MTKNTFTLLLALCAPLTGFAQDAKIKLNTASDQLQFEVSYKDQAVILPSNLGFNIDNRDLGKNAKIESVKASSKDSKTYHITTKDNESYFIETKEFDDGIALRYRFPSTTARTIHTESTSFEFPEGTRVWYASGPFQYGWIQHYQDRLISDINNELLAPPATFLLPEGIYAAISEANLFNFHGAVLFGRPNNTVQLGYVENKAHVETGKITGLPAAKYWHEDVRDLPWIVTPKSGETEITTPWRILMLADNLNGLVNNQIISKVSDHPDTELFPRGKDTEWIKPGRSVFTWLAEDENRLSIANHKKYIDGASKIGLESVVVDDGWELWAETEANPDGLTKWDFMEELVQYGKERNVDIWVWRPSFPRNGNKTDVGLEDAQERSNFMKKCHDIGIRGLKIDFFHTENLFTVNFMEDILKDAAKNELMVVFHGVNKPTGDAVTYPNLMAKEAVRGLEGVGGEDSWAPGAPWPYHNTVLPFTRWLVGPADYTPLNFRNFCPPTTTFTHQLASIYMFDSPMLILAADMSDMLTTPGREFIEDVPAEWDETIVLDNSKIGELAALARRKGDIWYLTILNGEEPVEQKIKLDFLPKGSYKMTSASDNGKDRKLINIHNSKVKAGQTIKVKLMSGGGYLVKFEKL